MASVVSMPLTGNNNINGILYTTRWSGTVTYDFPDLLPGYYTAGQVPGFTQVSFEQRQAVRGILDNSGSGQTYGAVEFFTNLNFEESPAFNDAVDLEIFQADSIYGSNIGTAQVVDFPEIGDVSLNNDGGDVVFDSIDGGGSARNPIYGDYYYHQHMHELGHALGLKHSHDASYGSGVAVSSAFDAMEYTVMAYRSYQNDPLIGGYSNETYGYATTFMALDILALQSMYGADYTTNNTDTTYSWSPTTGQMFVNGVGQQTPGANRIFLTIWDGGGNDWYNFSNYTNNVSVDLRPGQYSLNSTTQRANLGDGNFAHGTVYNSFLFNNSGLSYIENAIGGTGNDTFVGNDANNALYGLAGNDTFTGFGGNDYLAGGIGIDAMYGGDGNDYLNGEAGADFASGDAGNDVLVTGPDNDSLNGGAGIDSLFAGAGNDYLVGGSGTDYFYQYGDAVQNGSLDYIFDFSGTEDYLIAPLANIAGAQFFNSGGAAWMAIWTGSAWSYTAVFGVTAAQLTPHVLWQ